MILNEMITFVISFLVAHIAINAIIDRHIVSANHALPMLPNPQVPAISTRVSSAHGDVDSTSAQGPVLDAKMMIEADAGADAVVGSGILSAAELTGADVVGGSDHPKDSFLLASESSDTGGVPPLQLPEEISGSSAHNGCPLHLNPLHGCDACEAILALRDARAARIMAGRVEADLVPLTARVADSGMPAAEAGNPAESRSRRSQERGPPPLVPPASPHPPIGCVRYPLGYLPANWGPVRDNVYTAGWMK